ncbi:DUF4113 domain-containing protein [Pseudomonas aeruginosa]|uniref:DUF4113 domain-containing protein n=1 Tax=Pseudomonas aeruginosa TaxID=287 RepID=UPI003F5AC6D4
MDPVELSRRIGSHNVNPLLLAFTDHQTPQGVASRHVKPVRLAVLFPRLVILFYKALHHSQSSLRPVLGPPAGLHSVASCPTIWRTIARLLLTLAPLNRIDLAGVIQEEGRGTVRIGRIPKKPKWAMRREMLSQRYTTCWDELVGVSARSASPCKGTRWV